jgi:hypothetical protein
VRKGGGGPRFETTKRHTAAAGPETLFPVVADRRSERRILRDDRRTRVLDPTRRDSALKPALETRTSGFLEPFDEPSERLIHPPEDTRDGRLAEPFTSVLRDGQAGSWRNGENQEIRRGTSRKVAEGRQGVTS